MSLILFRFIVGAYLLAIIACVIGMLATAWRNRNEPRDPHFDPYGDEILP